MRTVAITGSASGIGAATRARLERDGHRVIGVDVRDAEVVADLATPAGRDAAVRGVRDAGGGRLDGLVACAGLGPHLADRARIVAVNYFGAAATLEGLRDALAAGDRPGAVVVSSNSSSLPLVDTPLVAACLADDEAEARRLAASLDGTRTYGGAKRALTRRMRRLAASPAWAGAGIRLNAVAPGPIRTPLLQSTMDDALLGPAVRQFPVPIGGFGTPEQVAAAIAFLLSPDTGFCVGSVLFVDGGTDALLRPDDY